MYERQLKEAERKPHGSEIRDPFEWVTAQHSQDAVKST